MHLTRNFQLQSSLAFGMAIGYRIFGLNKYNHEEEPVLKHQVKDSRKKSKISKYYLMNNNIYNDTLKNFYTDFTKPL